MAMESVPTRSRLRMLLAIVVGVAAAAAFVIYGLSSTGQIAFSPTLLTSQSPLGNQVAYTQMQPAGTLSRFQSWLSNDAETISLPAPPSTTPAPTPPSTSSTSVPPSSQGGSPDRVLGVEPAVVTPLRVAYAAVNGTDLPTSSFVRVQRVYPESPAKEFLAAGDVITGAVAGPGVPSTVHTADELIDVLIEAGPSAQVTLQLRSGGVNQVTLTDRASLGVEMVTAETADVALDVPDLPATLLSPPATLAAGVLYADMLTDGSLLAGRSILVLAQMDDSGHVLPVTNFGERVSTASSIEPDLVFVHPSQDAEARSTFGDRVVSAPTLAGMLAALGG